MLCAGWLPGEGNPGGGIIKGGQQPVSQVMGQAQQVIYNYDILNINLNIKLMLT